MKGTLLFIGTGNSLGVPIIGCECSVCRSESPKNKRLRPSAVLSVEDQVILIDAGPDFRTQALKYGITHLDGVLFTHAHHDHTAGLDDLRIYYLMTKEPLRCLLSEATAEDLQQRYDYIFRKKSEKHQLTTKIDLQVLPHDRGIVSFLGVEVRYVSYEQAKMQVNGYSVGNLAYISDIRHYPDSLIDDLQGTEILVLSALRDTPSPLHFSVQEAVDFAKKVGAKQTWLTHVAHELDHEKTNANLPPDVQLAHDGLTINFEI